MLILSSLNSDLPGGETRQALRPWFGGRSGHYNATPDLREFGVEIIHFRLGELRAEPGVGGVVRLDDPICYRITLALGALRDPQFTHDCWSYTGHNLVLFFGVFGLLFS